MRFQVTMLYGERNVRKNEKEMTWHETKNQTKTINTGLGPLSIRMSSIHGCSAHLVGLDHLVPHEHVRIRDEFAVVHDEDTH